jgi:hypothetical protein
VILLPASGNVDTNLGLLADRALPRELEMARGVLRQMVVIMSTISVLLAWTGSGHAISDLLGLDQNPALPVTIDTTLVAPTGKTISVAAGQDLQAALNSAQPGDVVSIASGATFTGNFVLPKKDGDGVITVRTSTPDADLPAPGTRVTPAQADLMPKLISLNSAPTLSAAAGAQGYRLIGLDVSVAPSVSTIFNIVAFGGDQTSLADTPSNLVVDRSYIHGQPQTNAFRGVLLNSARSAVIDSYVSDIHVSGFDSQAILGYNGPGPFKIVNNHLEGAGENIMFGGADSKSPALSPADIEIRKNQLFKPLSWNPADPSFAGIAWTVKNLLELKNAQRVLVDGNSLENNWGTAVVLTPRNQDGTAPWSVVQDVTFSNNRIKNVLAGIATQGFDDGHPSQQLQRVVLKNNLWENTKGIFALMVGPINGVTIDHNTVLGTTFASIFAANAQSPGFKLTNNILAFGVIGGDSTAPGDPAIAMYFPDSEVLRNALIGVGEKAVPAMNFLAVDLADVGFIDPVTGDFRLSPLSRFHNAATDGTDIGVDFMALMQALLGVDFPTGPVIPGDPGCAAEIDSAGCLSTVPEPASLLLLGSALAGLGMAVARRSRRSRGRPESD